MLNGNGDVQRGVTTGAAQAPKRTPTSWRPSNHPSGPEEGHKIPVERSVQGLAARPRR